MKLRLVAALAGALAASVALAGCAGNVGPTVSRDRDISDVTAVSLLTSGDLTITTGDEPTLTITAGQDVIDRLTSEVHDGVLVLDYQADLRNPGKITYALVLPAVDTIRVAGSGDVQATLAPTAHLAISVAGSGDATVRGVDVDDLAVDVAGSGDVHATGSAGRQAVNVKGSGDYAGAALDSRDAVVSVSGAGDAEVHVTRTLDAVIGGSGSISHSGGATVTSDISESGDIIGR